MIGAILKRFVFVVAAAALAAGAVGVAVVYVVRG